MEQMHDICSPELMWTNSDRHFWINWENLNMVSISDELKVYWKFTEMDREWLLIKKNRVQSNMKKYNFRLGKNINIYTQV